MTVDGSNSAHPDRSTQTIMAAQPRRIADDVGVVINGTMRTALGCCPANVQSMNSYAGSVKNSL